MSMATRIARERSFLRVARLTGQLDGLLEALQGEDDAGRERGEDAVHAVRQRSRRPP